MAGASSTPLRRAARWLGVTLMLLMLLAGLALWLAQRWLAGDGPRQQIERAATQALGVALSVDAMQITVWPLPAVTLTGVQLATQPALSAGRVDLRPDWLALARREPAVSSLLLRDVKLPQAGLDALAAKLGGSKKPAGTAETHGSAPLPLWLPRRTSLQGVTWLSHKGQATTVDGEIMLGSDGLPVTVALAVVDGAWKATRLDLKRGQDNDKGWPVWELDLAVADGTVRGNLAAQLPGIAPVAAKDWALDARLEARGVDVTQFTAPSKVLSGKLEASSKLQARAAEPGGLAAALQSQTSVTIRGATLHGLDLVKAVETVGLNRGGETRLDTLAGQVHTRGQAIQLSNLVASSGALSATGQVNISPARALEGRISVDVASGVVGVPLVVGGTLEAPTVTLTRGALLGAAIGTAVMPGVGTGAGAKLGDRLGEAMKGLFGGKK